MQDFLEEVPAESKLFMAFNDPQDIYEKVFDGYRQLVELPAYECSEKQVLFFPEWWGVFELNYEGAPEIWGRSPEQVKSNMEYWNAEYVITYDEAAETSVADWNQQGFKQVAEFDWSLFQEDFADHKHIDVSQLKWYLWRKGWFIQLQKEAEVILLHEWREGDMNQPRVLLDLVGIDVP